MNGCFTEGWYDACAVMMRRLLETCIIEAFEARGVANNIKNAAGDYFQLTDLINSAINERTWTLSRNTRAALPQLRDIGHLSAHSRYYHARRGDIERVRTSFRIAVEEFLHHARLL